MFDSVNSYSYKSPPIWILIFLKFIPMFQNNIITSYTINKKIEIHSEDFYNYIDCFLIFMYRKSWDKSPTLSSQHPPPNAYFWSSDFQNSFWFWKFRKIHDVWLRAFFDKCLLRPLKLLPHFLGKISPLSYHKCTFFTHGYSRDIPRRRALSY